MKLKNKRTGEIVELKVAVNGDLAITKDDEIIGIYSSLAELNAEWEDYKEPKSWWYIDCNGEVFRGENADKEHTDEHKSIGNYYTSSKEAQKAVRKLEAWKLLKDMGFKIEGIRYRDNKNYIEWSISQKVIDDHFAAETFNDALHLLFGGEER